MAERRAMNRSLLLIALVAKCTALPPSCDKCYIRSLDNCAAGLFLFATGNKVPETDADREDFCRSQSEAQVWSRDYVQRCTRGMTRGFADDFLDDIKKEIMERCFKSGSYRDDFTKYAPCLNKVGSKFHTCVKNFIMDLDVASRLEPRQRITGGCCKYKKLEVCMSDAIRGTCDKGAHDFVKRLLKHYEGNMLGILCANDWANAKCEAIKYDDKPGDASLRSVIAPLIKVLEAIDA
nr:uncharacterized protein LOC119168000 [Rhipicephalus microplus]